MATSTAKLGGPARRDVLRAGVYGLGSAWSAGARRPCSAARRRPPRPPASASWSWWSCPAPMTGSIPSCRSR